MSLDLLQKLYKPAPAIPVAHLQDMADGLQAQIITLSMDPTPAACETVAANLDGARRAILRLRAPLMEVVDE